MVKLNSLKVDPQRSNEGVWFDWTQGVRLLIARIGNASFDSRLRELMDGEKAAGNEDISRENLTMMAVAETVLLGWEGIEDDDGEPLEWSVETSYALLSDEALADLYKFVIIKASEVAHYRFKADKDAAKN
jgi:hypothetical protein